MAIIIEGKRIAGEIREEIKREVEGLKKRTAKSPCLSVILVGNDPASAIYVRNKKKACAEAGIESREYLLPAAAKKKEILTLVERLNQDPQIHGILVQLPLPPQLKTEEIIESISPRKDVDCFHPSNLGKVLSNTFIIPPCTPAGIVELLVRSGIEIEGKRAVIIGRSNIVGKPLSLLLLHRHATVTLCHSRTLDLKGVSREADILVAALGRAHFVTPEFVKEGGVVIDVGINRLEGKLAGDVDFSPVSKKAAYITPVPGGVGPMTIAMLLKNTLTLFKIQSSLINEATTLLSR